MSVRRGGEQRSHRKVRGTCGVREKVTPPIHARRLQADVRAAFREWERKWGSK